MDILGSFGTRHLDWQKLTNFSSLKPNVQKHLKNVYMTLMGMLALAAAGVLAQIKLQFDVMFSGLAALGFLFWLMMTPHNQGQETKRQLLLGTFGFLKGATVGPLVHTSLMMDPALVGVAFAGTAAIFACFSIAAMCAKRRSYLYLMGSLSSAMSLLCLLGFVNIFVQSPAIYLFKLYAGLLVFNGYVIYDTQVIIEHASNVSNPDHILDACNLFIDFAAIFVRILIILMRNQNNKQKKDDRRNRR